MLGQGQYRRETSTREKSIGLGTRVIPNIMSAIVALEPATNCLLPNVSLRGNIHI